MTSLGLFTERNSYTYSFPTDKEGNSQPTKLRTYTTYMYMYMTFSKYMYAGSIPINLMTKHTKLKHNLLLGLKIYTNSYLPSVPPPMRVEVSCKRATELRAAGAVISVTVLEWTISACEERTCKVMEEV